VTRRHQRRRPRPRKLDARTLRGDAVAGIPGALASVPDGMASAALVGVNPVYGLYASMAGPIGGGLTASTRLMVITTTTAAALAAGSAVEGFQGDERAEALFLLTVLAGALMVAAGVLRLGRFARFVSVSVLTGFLTGVAVNIVCGQLSDLLGAPASGAFALAEAWDVVTHPDAITGAAAAVGLGALAILVVLGRTRAAAFAPIVALVVPTLLALGAESVARVSDAGPIPTGVPLPHLPDLGLLSASEIWIGAAAVTIIVLVQGTGVAEVAPNPDGSIADANRDFMAQGAGNLASGLFRGQPVGGSVGQTALNISAGARTRWAAVFSGVWMLFIVVAFSGVVGEIAVPTLAAVLIYAAVSSLRAGRIDTVLRSGMPARIAFIATLASTLVLPVAAAVGIGVTLSLLLQLNREASDLRLVRLEPTDDGRLLESPAPAELESCEVTMLDVYGSLQFAGARTVQARLPDPAGAIRPAVVLRLRGRRKLGATGLIVLADYADHLGAVGGKLFLSGVDSELADQLRRTGRVDVADAVTVVPAGPHVGGSTLRAYRAAQQWLREGERPSATVADDREGAAR
jgi:SulP family sulfate permease